MYISKTLKKFNKDKSPKYFPGSTIIQDFTDQDLLGLIKSIKDEYLGYSFSEKLVFLPEDSYHMTVTGLMTYDYLKDNPWQGKMPDPSMSAKKLDEYCITRLESILGALHVRMVVSGFNENKILLVPKTEKDRAMINSYRKNILDRVGLRFDEDYQFHISLNYTLMNLDVEDYAEIAKCIKSLERRYLNVFGDFIISSPILAFYDDMTEFWDYRTGRQHQEF